MRPPKTPRWMRFVNDPAIQILREQIALLKSIDPSIPIRDDDPSTTERAENLHSVAPLAQTVADLLAEKSIQTNADLRAEIARLEAEIERLKPREQPTIDALIAADELPSPELHGWEVCFDYYWAKREQFRSLREFSTAIGYDYGTVRNEHSRYRAGKK